VYERERQKTEIFLIKLKEIVTTIVDNKRCLILPFSTGVNQPERKTNKSKKVSQERSLFFDIWTLLHRTIVAFVTLE
jgi:hypothetical protein